MKNAVDGAGDTWTWTALDSDSKLIISWLVGGRDGEYTLTHEHLNGEAIPVARGPEPEHPNALGNVLRFGRIHEHLKRQLANK